ncbi:MAG: hypothetical protein HC924_18635 [Synechococcaceae cyanobacterium SM2_3_2]|nr:hypothetical protein [Synechococcaceae cyanobacterium SM2_3_2]
MRSSIVKPLSVALLTGLSVLLVSVSADAQQLRQNRTVEPRAPYIIGAQVSGGLARDHIIEVGVAEVEVTGLVIECFNLNNASDVTIRNSNDEFVEADVTIEPTKLTIVLAEPAQPGESLSVSIEGIDFVQDGNATFYFVSASTPDTGDTAVPVGSARILAPARGNSNS